MNKNIQRIGIGGRRIDDVTSENQVPKAGFFTFDSTTVTFDSDVDTFDFDIVPVIPVVFRDYAEKDYSTDYK